jgi:hypothetical protein
MKSMQGVVFLFVGAVLFVWGLRAWGTLSSHGSAEMGAGPQDQVTAMLALGALLGITGLVRLVRRA